jgi:hypothetical protein
MFAAGHTASQAILRLARLQQGSAKDLIDGRGYGVRGEDLRRARPGVCGYADLESCPAIMSDLDEQAAVVVVGDRSVAGRR